MGIPEDAFKLLSTDDPIEAMRLAEHLEKINAERKGLVASIVKEAKSQMKKRENVPAVIVIGNPEWRPSLLGLVANSLADEYERPIFAWGRDGDNVLKGSCRSYNNYDLHALMTLAKDSFLEFGGHKGAGGFSVSLELLPNLEANLSKALESLASQEDSQAENLQIELKDIGESLWLTVSQFAPFGFGNQKPVFKIVNAPVRGVKQFGKTREHMEIMLTPSLKAISFFATPKSYSLSETAESCTLLAHLEKSYFRNRPELRLRIVDILE
jgi:single-stranded-DNA-specific exonuclease